MKGWNISSNHQEEEGVLQMRLTCPPLEVDRAIRFCDKLRASTAPAEVEMNITFPGGVCLVQWTGKSPTTPKGYPNLSAVVNKLAGKKRYIQ